MVGVAREIPSVWAPGLDWWSMHGDGGVAPGCGFERSDRRWDFAGECAAAEVDDEVATPEGPRVEIPGDGHP